MKQNQAQPSIGIGVIRSNDVAPISLRSISVTKINNQPPQPLPIAAIIDEDD